jgi:hypothetical protein
VKRFSNNRSPQADSLAAAIHERTDDNPLFMIDGRLSGRRWSPGKLTRQGRRVSRDPRRR